MANQKRAKVVKYKKPFHVNLGLLIFLFVFLYLAYSIYAYFTQSHISTYEVARGTIANNSFYKGLIIRDETVFQSEEAGYLTFYGKDASKVGVGSFICSVDEKGDFYKQLREENSDQLNISRESYLELDQISEDFANRFTNAAFGNVYQYKYDLETGLVEAIGQESLKNSDLKSKSASGFHVYQSSQDGVIVHHVDGYENVKTDSFFPDVYHPESIERVTRGNHEHVDADAPIYKLVTGEDWSIVIPIDQSLVSEYQKEENKSIQVEFKKDYTRAWASAKVVTQGEESFLLLSFKNSMIRFASDRYLELELLSNHEDGLKIPRSAIVEKDFLTVPKDYLTRGGDSGQSGLLKEEKDKSGAMEVVFVPVSVYEETEDKVSILSDRLTIGDSVRKPESEEGYLLGETKTLEGVYSVNKGYAVFKQIEVLFQNGEYAMIKNGTSYGIALYDHIALAGDKVREDEIVHVSSE